MVMKELQICFGDIYLGGGIFANDVLFIMENIRIYCQMDAGEFDGLLYNILSEEPFKNQLFLMTEETDYYTISDYVSQYFGMLIGETWTCITCHTTPPPPQILKYDSFILPLGEISHKDKKWRAISHEKKSHFSKSCVTMTYFMVKFYEILS